jgi:hypothetical protein
MLKELDLPSLQDRRKHQRLIFFYKMVEGQIPAIPADSSNSNTTNETSNLKHLKTLKAATSSASDQGIIQDP